MSTRVIQEKRPFKLPTSTASSWRWSSMHRPSEVSCCCREDGWLNVASPGPHASDDSPGTTSASQTLSLDSTTSPSLASCSPNSSPCSTKVKNSLLESCKGLTTGYAKIRSSQGA